MTPRPRMSLVSPSLAMRAAAAAIVLIIGVGGGLLIWQYPQLPDLLPVHFRPNGRPNGWQYKTWARVMMPVLVQLALALPMGAVATLLLSRAHGVNDDEAPDVKAARTAAEAVTMLALIWVAFQAYAAFALVGMWSRGRSGLGLWYTYFELSGIVLTGLVAVRAHLTVGRPEPRDVRARALALRPALRERRRSGPVRPHSRRFALDAQLRPAGRRDPSRRAPGRRHPRPDARPLARPSLAVRSSQVIDLQGIYTY